MHSSQPPPILADAADVLSDQLRTHLERLSCLLKPHAGDLDRRFRTRLRQRRYDPRQIKALSDITAGAAARFFAAGRLPGEFFEQVEYSGRRLAKLNVSPAGIVRALGEYDRVLDPVLILGYPEEYKNFRWARGQLQFAVILSLNNAYYQVRDAETQAFFELFQTELQAGGVDDLLKRFLETLTRFCHAADGRLSLFGGPKSGRPSQRLLKRLATARLIARGGRDETLILDVQLRACHPWFWSVPLVSDGRVEGVLQFAFATEYHWLPRELDLLDAAAGQCLRAAEKARLMEDLAQREEQVRRLGEHLMQIEEEERRRISRELHDEAGQSLLCVRLQLELLGRTAPAQLRRELTGTRKLVERTIAEIRRILAALSPAVLEQLGLAASIRQMTAHFRRVYPGRVRLDVPARLGPVSSEIQIAAFRLVQECFHNIAKHSGASTVNLSLHHTDELLRLTVADDGVGFDVKAALEKPKSFGLAGMRERVALMGGRFEIVSRPNRGTKILVELPLSAAHRKRTAASLRQSA